ncbi:hypothetical protein [Psittacicella hinzii]|uniref:Porin n=1 Tax=Psittacicella hinzii TaxID=2028575 RepID=A0A3A1YP48_9GAMM|nr:hypothetical protein [Psittacicella hinzii]RIY39385.1 hypothetical protein CKF58_02285 [Psittacicella hinzii]
MKKLSKTLLALALAGFTTHSALAYTLYSSKTTVVSSNIYYYPTFYKWGEQGYNAKGQQTNTYRLYHYARVNLSAQMLAGKYTAGFYIRATYSSYKQHQHVKDIGEDDRGWKTAKFTARQYDSTVGTISNLYFSVSRSGWGNFQAGKISTFYDGVPRNSYNLSLLGFDTVFDNNLFYISDRAIRWSSPWYSNDTSYMLQYATDHKYVGTNAFPTGVSDHMFGAVATYRFTFSDDEKATKNQQIRVFYGRVYKSKAVADYYYRNNTSPASFDDNTTDKANHLEISHLYQGDNLAFVTSALYAYEPDRYTRPNRGYQVTLNASYYITKYFIPELGVSYSNSTKYSLASPGAAIGNSYGKKVTRQTSLITGFASYLYSDKIFNVYFLFNYQLNNNRTKITYPGQTFRDKNISQNVAARLYFGIR